MIEITIFTKEDEYIGVESQGHARYAEAGTDIVCSATSVLLINTINAIEAFSDDEFDCNQEDGYLDYHLTGTISEGSALLMKTLVLGITDIQKSYGDEYIKTIIKEV